MGSSGTVRIEDVVDALDHCLPGCIWKATDHHWCIYPPRGEPYRTFPKGRHGARHNVEIQKGWVRGLARHFNITDCFKRRISSLG